MSTATINKQAEKRVASFEKMADSLIAKMEHDTSVRYNQMPTRDSARLLTVSQAAVWLNLSRPTVYQLCERKQIEYFRLGAGKRGIRIDAKELDAFLERRRVQRHELPPEKARRARSKAANPLRLVHLSMPDPWPS
ncbi:MAG TPA: helix-turn-helix domain-containing protein [Pirellulales bacterium]|jgi:excisionase family DNA binding protein